MINCADGGVGDGSIRDGKHRMHGTRQHLQLKPSSQPDILAFEGRCERMLKVLPAVPSLQETRNCIECFITPSSKTNKRYEYKSVYIEELECFYQIGEAGRLDVFVCIGKYPVIDCTSNSRQTALLLDAYVRDPLQKDLVALTIKDTTEHLAEYGMDLAALEKEIVNEIHKEDMIDLLVLAPRDTAPTLIIKVRRCHTLAPLSPLAL